MGWRLARRGAGAHGRVATPDELERAVRAHGPTGARAALRRYGLIPPIGGASGPSLTQAITSNGTTVTFTGAVAAGDFLYAIYCSASSGSASNTVTAIADNINGSWTILDNSGSTSELNNGFVTGAVAYFANSASASANGLTVTVTMSGGASSGLVACDVAGAATSSAIVAHGQNPTTSVTGGASPYSFTTPAETDASSGDWVIGYVCSYDGTITSGTGATLDGTTHGTNGVSYVGAYHLTANSAIGSNSVNGKIAQNARNMVTGTVIVAAAGGASAAAIPPPPINWPQAMWRSAYR